MLHPFVFFLISLYHMNHGLVKVLTVASCNFFVNFCAESGALVNATSPLNRTHGKSFWKSFLIARARRNGLVMIYGKHMGW